MIDYQSLSATELKAELENLKLAYKAQQEKGLNLDMTRGKPAPEQLDLSLDMLNIVDRSNFTSPSGVDSRNYGGLDGLDEVKSMFSAYLEVPKQNVVIGGNSSLTLMHDTMVKAMLRGVSDSTTAWGKLPKIKFLCPSPGYDRHFSICEKLDIEMVTVPMNADGPDMDQVEALVKADDSIKGMWLVPKYSNPTGITFSDEVVDRLAAMQTAAADFRIFWDNAYTAHHLTDSPDKLKNILEACEKNGNANRVFIFGSTSKITFAGAGLAAFAGSDANVTWMKENLFIQTIGPDKVNQLRHLYFFKDIYGIEQHMQKHAAILLPKFETVIQTLDATLKGSGLAQYTMPNGGYFISLDTLPGCAKKVVQLAGEAGVKMTAAGATFPYKKDPQDCNIRLAPSLPSIEEIRTAMEVLSTCIRMASVEKMIEEKATAVA